MHGHHHHHDGRRRGPLARLVRGVLFLAALPFIAVVSVALLPVALVARLLGFAPGRHCCRRPAAPDAA
jgi:hypothetical protein